MTTNKRNSKAAARQRTEDTAIAECRECGLDQPEATTAGDADQARAAARAAFDAGMTQRDATNAAYAAWEAGWSPSAALASARRAADDPDAIDWQLPSWQRYTTGLSNALARCHG